MSAGDAIVIYCAGLGPVNPPVAAGSAAPSSPPAVTTNPVTVTIGGKSAQVFFSGFVGGFAGPLSGERLPCPKASRRGTRRRWLSRWMASRVRR